jgi:hypothetical protein
MASSGRASGLRPAAEAATEVARGGAGMVLEKSCEVAGGAEAQRLRDVLDANGLAEKTIDGRLKPQRIAVQTWADAGLCAKQLVEAGAGQAGKVTARRGIELTGMLAQPRGGAANTIIEQVRDRPVPVVLPVAMIDRGEDPLEIRLVDTIRNHALPKIIDHGPQRSIQFAAALAEYLLPRGARHCPAAHVMLQGDIEREDVGDGMARCGHGGVRRPGIDEDDGVVTQRTLDAIDLKGAIRTIQFDQDMGVRMGVFDNRRAEPEHGDPSELAHCNPRCFCHIGLANQSSLPPQSQCHDDYRTRG